MTDKSDESERRGIDRRTILRGIGVSSAVGVVGLPALSNPVGADHVDITNGLVAHYPLDGTSGAVEDVSGNNDGTNNGATRGEVGPDNEAFEFDGADDYVDVADDGSLDLVGDALTVAAWFKTASSSRGGLVRKNDSDDWWPAYNLEVNRDTAGEVEFLLRDTNTHNIQIESTSTDLNDSEWHHAAGTYDPSTDEMALYIDGSEEASTTESFSTADTTGALQIGRMAQATTTTTNTATAYFDGQIDDIRIYNRVLSDPEIEQLATRLIIVDDDIDDEDENEFRKNTIQEGVDAAQPGDTIRVEAGTYNEVDIFLDKSLTLTGDPGKGNAAGCGANAPVIDGGGVDGSAFLLADGVSDVTIEGFEMTNFDGSRGSGVEAWNVSTTDITVRDNCINDNVWNGVLVGSDGSTTHSGWSVKRNVVEDNGFAQIELTNCSSSSIAGNEVSNGFASLLVQARNTIPDSGELTVSGVSVKNNDASKSSFGLYSLAMAASNAFTAIDGAEAILEDLNVGSNTFEEIGSGETGLLLFPFAPSGGDPESSATISDPKSVRNDFVSANDCTPPENETEVGTGIRVINSDVVNAKLVNNDFVCLATDVVNGGEDTKQPPVPENPS